MSTDDVGGLIRKLFGVGNLAEVHDKALKGVMVMLVVMVAMLVVVMMVMVKLMAGRQISLCANALAQQYIHRQFTHRRFYNLHTVAR